MGIFKFPHSDFHELNLDWFIQQWHKVMDTLRQTTAEAQTVPTSQGASVDVTGDGIDTPLHFLFDIPKGESITGTEVRYGVSDDREVQPTTWTQTIPVVQPGEFLWTRFRVLTDGNTLEYYMATRYGLDGEGSVVSVNGVSPDADGNVSITIPAASSTAPLPDATSAAVGTSAKYARQDHVHPAQNLRRKYILIGDSYNNRLSTSIESTWGDKIKPWLLDSGAASVYSSGISGAGFYNGNYTAQITALSYDDTVTDVVVAGGANDGGVGTMRDGIAAGIVDFCEAAREKFPNAHITIAWISWTRDKSRGAQYYRAFAEYVRGAARNGCAFIDASRALHKYSYISSDNLHPTETGTTAIAHALALGLLGDTPDDIGYEYSDTTITPVGEYTIPNPTLLEVLRESEVDITIGGGSGNFYINNYDWDNNNWTDIATFTPALFAGNSNTKQPDIVLPAWFDASSSERHPCMAGVRFRSAADAGGTITNTLQVRLFKVNNDTLTGTTMRRLAIPEYTFSYNKWFC